jgi:signal peptidase I
MKHIVTTELVHELRAAYYEKIGQAWLTVKTGSMEPLINPGDRVLMSAVTARDVRRGEIIVFKRNESLIGHRVLKKQRTVDGIRFIEKGDNSDICGAFHEGDIIGRVIAVKGRKRQLYLNTPPGRLAGKFLAVWFSCVSTVRSGQTPPGRKACVRPGSVFARLLRLVSGLLVRMCGPVWYLAGRYSNIRYENQ